MLILVLFLLAITEAGVLPCGGPKKSLRTSSIVHIIFSFWSFEISEGILNYQKFIIGLDTFSNQHYIYIWLCLDNTSLRRKLQITVFLFGSIGSLKRLM